MSRPAAVRKRAVRGAERSSGAPGEMPGGCREDAVTSGRILSPGLRSPAGPCPGPAAQRGPESSRSRAALGGSQILAQGMRPAGTERLVLHVRHQGLGNDFGNQSEGDRYSLLAFVIIKKKSLKYKFKRQKWLLCMRSNCLSKKSPWDFIPFFLLRT